MGDWQIVRYGLALNYRHLATTASATLPKGEQGG